MTQEEEMPTMTCPRCGAEHPDFDGFGMVAHTKPAFADGCGWCSHPARDGHDKGHMVCGICGDVLGVLDDEVIEKTVAQIADRNDMGAWGMARAIRALKEGR